MTAPGAAPSSSIRAAQRVLVVSSELPPGPGGIGAHAMAVARVLAGQGRDVAILASQHYTDDATRQAYNATAGLPITTFADAADPLRTARRRRRQLLDAIESFRPDVVLTSGGRVQWLAAGVRRRSGVPFVAVVHGSELGGPAWQQRLTRAALGHASRVIAVSRFSAGLTSDLGVERPIDVVLNGADGDRFAPDPGRRDRFRAAHELGDRPMVLTVGNVTERKGQHQVVAALPEIVARCPDVAYVVVGRPTEAAALQERARALGVAEHLLVVGQADDDEVVDAHCAADVFAMTSTNTGSGDVEGFGIAVVEAALSGVPAVVTTGTGAQEAISHDVTGRAVDPSPAAIADAIAALLTDEPRRREMGRAAEAAARAGATWAHRGAQYGPILDDAVVGSKPRIVVISHTPHHRTADGSVVGFGATTRELDQLATLASELVHIAPLYPGPPEGMDLPALAPNLRFVPVPPAGGPRPVDRLLALRTVPGWAATINRELRTADVAHVRCPAGISMVALAVLAVRRAPRDRWVKYAGNWSPPGRDSITYRLQRSALRRGLIRAAVTVNGRWPDQPRWVHAFDNPTLTRGELAAGREAAVGKRPGPPFHAVFAGRLESPKGADIAVTTVLELRRRGHDITLDLVGDGPLRPWVEEAMAGPDGDAIRLQGWLRRDQLERFLATGHAFLLPTRASEGFPKVVGEAMAFGCVPVTTAVSSMGQTLRETGGSLILDPSDSWADAVESLMAPARWEELSTEGVGAVERFSFDTYRARVRALAAESWGRTL
ncbi:MAG TPA: glycosyltransferase [Acidimicrobiales bacterium]